MKIVFVNPPLTWEERYTIKQQSGGNTPPIGLTCLAAVTRDKGHATHIIDAGVLQLTRAQTAERILALRPDVVGFTASTIAIDNVVEIMQKIKKAVPGLTMIVGGPHITAVPEESFKRYEILGLAVLGEGEATIIDLLDFFE